MSSFDADPPARPPLARRLWAALEPIHAMGYFTPEPQAEYAAIGLEPERVRMRGYVPARSAPMGAVGPAAVHAVFYNFTERAIAAGLDGVWAVVSPEQVHAARLRGVQAALTRLLGGLLDGPGGGGIGEAAELAETAAAACTPWGRPLYAAHAALDPPPGEVARLWWAITLLREFRGDGHVAALTGAQLTGVEASVSSVAQGGVFTRASLQRLRGYTDEEWSSARASLHARGWFARADSDVLTDAGVRERGAVEERTDALAAAPWEHLGVDGCARLAELAAPIRQAVLDGDGFPPATRWRASA